MPRTIEHIVQCHNLAESRTKRGLSKWDGKLSFMMDIGPLAKRLEAGDTTLTAQTLLDAFKAAAQEIRSKIPQAQGAYFKMEDDDLEYFVLTMEEWTVVFIENCPDIFEEFDEALERLYDWCDINRWWIELAR